MKTLSFWTEQYSRLIILKNDLEKKRLSHSYLFGGRCEDIFSIAQSVAKYIHCSDQKSDGSCDTMCVVCSQISRGNCVDFLTVSPSGLSETIKMNDVTSFRDMIQTTPLVLDMRICLIQSVERFEQTAANAFLKILEEPPDRTLWILGSSNIHKVLPTVVSRCRTILLDVDHVQELVQESSEDFETIKDGIFQIFLALPQRKNVLKMIETLVESVNAFSEKKNTLSLYGSYDVYICNLLLLMLREISLLQVSSRSEHLIWPQKRDYFEDILPFVSRSLVEEMVSRTFVVQKNLHYHISLNNVLVYMVSPILECVV